MRTTESIETAPVPIEEPVRLPFAVLAPPALAHDPEACIREWRMSAILQCFEPVGEPVVMHVERALITVGGKPMWVQDDGSPVLYVAGDVVRAGSTRR